MIGITSHLIKLIDAKVFTEPQELRAGSESNYIFEFTLKEKIS